MIFTVILGILFLGIVFFHYLQGFFSSTLSAILAVLSAVLAFSWHEWVVEKLLGGRAANIAHSMVLVALFAFIYIILRTISDKAVPGQVTLPALVDRIGGAVMGLVTGIFALGILIIAAQELPLGPSVFGYSKYQTADVRARVPGAGGRMSEGENSDELNSYDAGRFKESDRQQTFPIVPVGADEFVIGAVSHLSGGGSLAGSQPLTSVHPDFLQELFGQRIGIQPGANHVTLNQSGSSDHAIDFGGVFSVSPVRIADGFLPSVRSRPPVLAVKTIREISINVGKPGGPEVLQKIPYAVADKDPANGKDLMFAVVRVTFGFDAADGEDKKIRISPGSVRLVARRTTVGGSELSNYYPVGTLEGATDGAVLLADKLDDFLMIQPGHDRDSRATIDFVFEVEKGTFLANGVEPPKVDKGVFIEVKRLVRKDLGGQLVNPWRPVNPGIVGLMRQQKLAALPTTEPSQPKADPAKKSRD